MYDVVVRAASLAPRVVLRACYERSLAERALTHLGFQQLAC